MPLRRTALRAKSQSPLAIARRQFVDGVQFDDREDGHWTCFTCGAKIDPRAKDEREYLKGVVYATLAISSNEDSINQGA